MWTKCNECGKDYSDDWLPFGSIFPGTCFNCLTPEQRVMERTGCSPHDASIYCQQAAQGMPTEERNKILHRKIARGEPINVTIT